MIKNIKKQFFFTITLLCVVVAICHGESFAEIQTGGVLDTVQQKFRDAASQWATTIQDRATWLFMTLTAISMVWTFSQLLFHRSSLAELFGELIRFMMFTGFYLWLLRNGPEMAKNIIQSLETLGRTASSQGAVSPSSLVDVGFEIFNIACKQSSFWSPLISAGCLVTSGIILIVLALVGINMLLMLCSAWVLAYAGIFFLGFGGCRWTSDMALNYFKTVLGVGANLMTMVLLVGIGTSIISEYHQKMTTNMTLQELAVLLVVSISLLLLTDKVPAMVSGIITGASIGSSGGGSFGAGAAVGAAMTAGSMAKGASSLAMGAAAMGGRVALAGAANMAGLASAFQNAKASFSGDGGGGGGGGLSSSMGNRSSSATEIGGNGGGSSSGSSDSTSNMGGGVGRSDGGGTSSSSPAGGGRNTSGSSAASGNASPSAMDIGKVMAKGAASMAGQAVSNAVSNAKQGFSEQVQNSMGGKLAEAIKNSSSGNNASPSAMDIGKVMAKGAASMAGQALSGAMSNAVHNAKQGFAERVQNSLGGKLAESIKKSSDAKASKPTDSDQNASKKDSGQDASEKGGDTPTDTPKGGDNEG